MISFDEAHDLLVEALLQHQRLQAFVLQLRQRVEANAADADLIEPLVGDEGPRALARSRRNRTSRPADS